jgi:Reverse transcriptase (RNA-dependent DNA polymerase)
VKRFDQKKRVNFEEIFSPVVKMSSIRIVLDLAASLNLEIEQLDVKTAFLCDDLEDELYMKQLESFEKNRVRALDMQVEEEPLWLETSAPKLV